MPGGVSSPVRAFPPYPVFMRKGRGARVWDVDGRGYLDLCMAFGPLILGHAHPAVVEAVGRQAANGMVFGAPTEGEVLLAEKIASHFPSMEMVRLTSSGTEATMHALRLARGFTKRTDIAAVEGGYHGAHDALLVKAGSGAATHAIPLSLGVTADLVKHTHLVPFNDPPALETLLRRRGDEIAAFILEPVLGNIGPVVPEPGYLRAVRKITDDHGVLLIFDEVITGFRLSLGGAQEIYGVRPDLTTLGKVLGGGLPVGAFGGRREIMEMVAPLGGVYQAGTFSGNPMTAAAGLATLEVLEREGLEGLNDLGSMMRRGLADLVEDLRLEYHVAGIGSMFQLFARPGPVRNYVDVASSDVKVFGKLFRGLLERGVYTPPSQFETDFLSLAHTEEEVEEALGAFRGALGALGR
jgi:glutamate-1-semialdehyde 2,1-aminomutase